MKCIAAAAQLTGAGTNGCGGLDRVVRVEAALVMRDAAAALAVVSAALT